MLRFQRLIAGKGDTCNRGAFPDKNDQHISLALQADILEETRLIQGTDDVSGLSLFYGLTHRYRHVIEYRSGGNTLQPFNPNILDHKGIGDNRKRQE